VQTVILCGGTGTRLKEQTEFLPKPLIQIGGKPMIWHIMQIYARYGFIDFVLALGYMQDRFKEYFSLFDEINNDVLVTRKWNGERLIQPIGHQDNWRIILSDTGANASKQQRLLRISRYITGGMFFCTYGDGVADIDINALLSFHLSHGKIATITGIHPAPRFGEILHSDYIISSFREKPDSSCLISGGFMVFNKEVFDFMSESDDRDLEDGVFPRLVEAQQLAVYPHKGFWKSMDTLKDMQELQVMWDNGTTLWTL
jgi:glucose-1-phosphate cytidylyltransferase